MTIKVAILAMLLRYWRWLTDTRLHRRVKEHLDIQHQLRVQHEAGDLDAKQYERLRPLPAAAIQRLYALDALPLVTRWRILLFGPKEKARPRPHTNEVPTHAVAA